MINPKIIAKKITLLWISFLLFFVLSGCDYFNFSQNKHKECVFRVKVSNENEEDGWKSEYVMFLLMYKTLQSATFSRPDGHSDYVNFQLHEDCRTVLEKILEKM